MLDSGAKIEKQHFRKKQTGTSHTKFSKKGDARFRQLHLLLFEYAIRIEEWNDSIQKEEAGGLDLHLGHRILFVVCPLPPQALIG